MTARPHLVVAALLALGACVSNDPLPQAGQPAVPTAVVVAQPQYVTQQYATPQYVTSNGVVMAPVVPQPTTVVVANGISGSSDAMPRMRLSAAEVGTLIPGNTAAGIAANGQPYYAFFRRTGGVEFRQATIVDSGFWRILPDGRICSTLTRTNNGAEECYSLYRNGTNVDYHRPDGNPLGTFTVEAGNPQNL
jgi:hypothetical protein